MYLLEAAAEVEHQFIVQYLYASWSLDPDTSPTDQWAGLLRQTALEEMGHLISVLNLLALVGSGPFLDLTRVPEPEPLPFPFSLEPFDQEFVARFLVAESPLDAPLPPELVDLKALTDHVGALYAMIYWLLQPTDAPIGPWRLPDDLVFPPGRHLEVTDFLSPEEAMERLSSPNDWFVTPAPDPTEPVQPGIHVLPAGATGSREEIRSRALEAVYDIAAQGEGPLEAEESHYQRLRAIYEALTEGATASVLNVPRNPHTIRRVPDVDPEAEAGLITDPTALLWARLFNVRYHMLLLDILHAVLVPASRVVEGRQLRQVLAGGWAVFAEDFSGGEMQIGIRDVAARLVTLPLKATQPGGLRAAPPFEPPTTPLPLGREDEHGRWEQHLALIREAKDLMDELGLPGEHPLRTFDQARTPFIEQRLTEDDSNFADNTDVAPVFEVAPEPTTPAFTKEVQMSNFFRLLQSIPREFAGGSIFRADHNSFPALQGLSLQLLRLEPGAIREPHIHPNAAQMDFLISGRAQVGILGPGGNRQVIEALPGHVTFVPQGHVHWIENTGDEQLEFLLILNHEAPQTIELSEMLAATPNPTLETTFSLSKEAVEALPVRAVVIGGEGY
ncbi:MAG: ferritin-like domain-containing protein [Longimicrobiaceae bacterium]